MRSPFRALRVNRIDHEAQADQSDGVLVPQYFSCSTTAIATQLNTSTLMESLCINTDLSTVFGNIEHAAAELWAIVDGRKTLYEERKTLDYDVGKYIKDMRDPLRILQAFLETMNIRAKQFDDYMSLAAMNYGLNLVPDEVLSEIFFSAAESLEEKVGLSLVSRRFRRVMMSTRKMWDGHYLEMGQTPEQMVAIAEGNRFDSLKAIIRSRDEVKDLLSYWNWARKQGLRPKKFADQFYDRSLEFILTLRLKTLDIRFLRKDEKEAQRILDSVAMQSAQYLVIVYCDNPILRSFERRHTPSLQSLDADFVPGPTVGRDLIRCKLSEVKDYELNSLREFLASTNTLQYLFLHTSNGGFYESCDLPSLRSLAVDFVPYSSFARHLTRFTLLWTNRTTLTGLLAFLSSTEALQALSIYGALGVIGAGLPFSYWECVATLPHLVSCDIQQTDHCFDRPLLVANFIRFLRMPVLRRLVLRFKIDVVGKDNGAEVFDQELPDIFFVPYVHLMRFEGCKRLTRSVVNTIVESFITITEWTQIEFDHCWRWKDGTFRLNEVNSAWLSQTCVDPDESESD